MIYPVGATSISVDVLFLDDSGLPVTGKAATDFTACQWSSGTNTADTAITLSDLSLITTAHPNDNTAGGLKEREGGVYRLDLPNNVFTSAGHKTVIFAYSAGKNIFLLSPLDVGASMLVADKTGFSLAADQAVNAAKWGGAAVTGMPMPTYTQPTGLLAATFPSGTLASTTNITAGTIATVTTLTNLPAIPANWLTAAGIAASALDGKGDWLLASGYTAPPSAATIAAAVEAAIMNEADGAAVLAAIVAKINAVDADLSGLSVAAIASAVWDVALASHLASGTTGAALNESASAGDPWASLIPGAYGTGTAGHRLGNLPDAAAGGTGGVALTGSKMDVVDAPNATAVTAIASAIGESGGLTDDQAAQLTDVQTKINALTLSDGGDGSVVVNQDTGGADALKIEDGTTHAGVDECTVRAYLKRDYDAGGRTIRGMAVTNVDGHWQMNLDPEVYTLTFNHDHYQFANTEVTVAS